MEDMCIDEDEYEWKRRDVYKWRRCIWIKEM